MLHKFQENKKPAPRFYSSNTLNRKNSPARKEGLFSDIEYQKPETYIRSLIKENESLKQELFQVTQKRDELTGILFNYESELEKAGIRIAQLEINLKDVEAVRSELTRVKQQILKRDDNINSLFQQTQRLGEKEPDKKHESNFSVKRSCLNPFEKTALSLTIEKLLKRIKSSSLFHEIFKTCTHSISSFIHLLEQDSFEEICIRLSKFSFGLMKETEKIINRNASLDFSACHQSSCSGLSCLKEAEIKGNNASQADEERYLKLNKEIQDVVAKSLEVLSSKSCSLLKCTPATDSVSRVYSQKPIDSTKDTVPDTDIHVRTSSKRVPRVEIKKPVRSIPFLKQTIIKKIINQ